MNDENDMTSDRRTTPDSADRLNEAIRHDRRADPAPVLSEDAMMRIMAHIPGAATGQAVPAQEDGHRDRAGDLRSFLAGFFRPPAWQAMAVASVAGIIAGAVTPTVSAGNDEITPEEEFATYLPSDDLFASLLEEDL